MAEPHDERDVITAVLHHYRQGGSSAPRGVPPRSDATVRISRPDGTPADIPVGRIMHRYVHEGLPARQVSPLLWNGFEQAGFGWTYLNDCKDVLFMGSLDDIPLARALWVYRFHYARHRPAELPPTPRPGTLVAVGNGLTEQWWRPVVVQVAPGEWPFGVVPGEQRFFLDATLGAERSRAAEVLAQRRHGLSDQAVTLAAFASALVPPAERTVRPTHGPYDEEDGSAVRRPGRPRLESLKA